MNKHLQNQSTEMQKRADDNFNQIRVLHVDDDEAVLSISKAYIEHLGKGRITVDSLQDSTQTLTVLKSSSYNVVVSDYRMSKIDGPKLVDIIEKAGIMIPVIMLTGGGSEEVVKTILNSGVDYYLTKNSSAKNLYKELVDVIFEIHKHKEMIDSVLKNNNIHLQPIKSQNNITHKDYN
ncbi:MAG: response regulator [Candidatus Heimdallarchaeaceae archaeon]